MKKKTEVVEIEVPTKSGVNNVKAFCVEGVTGLCVTMCGFGSFEITHRQTGLKLAGDFERFATAVENMLAYHIAGIASGIEWDCGSEALKKQIRECQIEHEVLGTTIYDALKLHRQCFSFGGEFPWESFEESPYGKIEKLEDLF